jgi:CO dehydrogenase/acetyl-CoA synthase beta subunit
MFDENLSRKKFTFLDSLKPDDFRNASSFNQADEIIDEIFKAAVKKVDRTDFVTKAAKNLFRENSPAVDQLVKLICQSQ